MHRFSKQRAFSSACLEHLPYKQRVGGSNPSTPTSLHCILKSVGIFVLLRELFMKSRKNFVILQDIKDNRDK